MKPGDTLKLRLTALDQAGVAMSASLASLSFSTSDSTTLRVSPSGTLTALAVGTAYVSARMTIGSITRVATMHTDVLPAVLPDTVVFASGDKGWLPAEAHVAVGGIVRWFSPPINWTGVTVTKVYLLDAETFAIVDSVDLSGGFGSHKFTVPGKVDFCSGGCWDPPDFGLIYVEARP